YIVKNNAPYEGIFNKESFHSSDHQYLKIVSLFKTTESSFLNKEIFKKEEINKWKKVSFQGKKKRKEVLLEEINGIDKWRHSLLNMRAKEVYHQFNEKKLKEELESISIINDRGIL